VGEIEIERERERERDVTRSFYSLQVLNLEKGGKLEGIQV
jgi:hypothetical protein